MFWFVIILILFILLALIIPIKIDLKYKVNTKDDLVEDIKYNLNAKMYLYGFLRIANIKKDKSNKVAKDNILIKIFTKFSEDGYRYLKLLDRKEIEKIMKNIELKRLNIKFDINTGNQVLNAYVVAIFYFIINYIVALNSNRINTKDFNYSVNISKKALDIEIDSIVKIKIVNTIIILLKFIYKLRKVDKKDERNTTSNRKSNVNSYDIT